MNELEKLARHCRIPEHALIVSADTHPGLRQYDQVQARIAAAHQSPWIEVRLPLPPWDVALRARNRRRIEDYHTLRARAQGLIPGRLNGSELRRLARVSRWYKRWAVARALRRHESLMYSGGAR